MPSTVDAALSDRVLRVDSQFRPGDVLEEYEQRRATHAAVFEAGRCLGIVPLPVVLEHVPQQTFAELLPSRMPAAISRELPLNAAARLLADSAFDAVPVTDDNGAHVGVVTRQSLLVALCEENEALARSESRLRSVLDNVPAIISQFDVDGRHVFVNRAVPGMAVEDILGRHITEVIPPEFRSELLSLLEQVAKDREPVRFAFPGVGARGTIVTYAGRIAPLVEDGQVRGLISVVTDATEDRQVEQSLRQSEQRLKQAINSVPVLLFATDRHGVYTLSEGKAVQAFGARPGDAVGKSAFERYRDCPIITDSIRRALAGEEFIAVAEIRGRIFECRCTPTHGPDGDVAGMIGVATDITERTQAERLARWFTRIVEHISLGLYVNKLEQVGDRYTFRNVIANPASERLTGVKVADWIGGTVDDSYPGLRERGVVDMARQVVETGVPIEFEHFQLATGNRPATDWTFMLFPLPEQHVGVAFQDISARKKAERQSRRLLDELAHTGRISDMGEMASGLAHELNQPLAAIVAYADACQELVESRRMDAVQLAEVLRSVSSQAERAGQIIHRLRKMIKRSQPVRAPMSINDAVREVTVLIETEARQSGVTMHEDLALDLPETEADFLQIQKVVLHLMRNGIEAMTDAPGGHRQLTVATRLTPRVEIEVAVCDQGTGLAGDAAERLFEPFFTTRTNGLGLGLSISRTIVEAHGGRIWITPNSTRGVTARFTLPASGGKVPDVRPTDRIHS